MISVEDMILASIGSGQRSTDIPRMPLPYPSTCTNIISILSERNSATSLLIKLAELYVSRAETRKRAAKTTRGEWQIKLSVYCLCRAANARMRPPSWPLTERWLDYSTQTNCMQSHYIGQSYVLTLPCSLIYIFISLTILMQPESCSKMYFVRQTNEKLHHLNNLCCWLRYVS